MKYIRSEKQKKEFQVGDWAVISRKVDGYRGYFEKGTKVKVIRKSFYRGYDLEDEYGNRIRDTGFNSIE